MIKPEEIESLIGQWGTCTCPTSPPWLQVFNIAGTASDQLGWNLNQLKDHEYDWNWLQSRDNPGFVTATVIYAWYHPSAFPSKFDATAISLVQRMNFLKVADLSSHIHTRQLLDKPLVRHPIRCWALNRPCSTSNFLNEIWCLSVLRSNLTRQSF